MDKDVLDAIAKHRQRFGEFDVTTLGLNIEEPSVKERLLEAISKSMADGVPLSDKAIGLDLAEGDLV